MVVIITSTYKDTIVDKQNYVLNYPFNEKVSKYAIV